MAQSFAATGIEYFNTYGGNSVACAIAEAVLDTISEEKLMSNALETGKIVLYDIILGRSLYLYCFSGNYLTEQLMILKKKHEGLIGKLIKFGFSQQSRYHTTSK